MEQNFVTREERRKLLREVKLEPVLVRSMTKLIQ